MKQWIDAAANYGWVLGAGIAGRLMFHSKEVQAGRRRFWGASFHLNS